MPTPTGNGANVIVGIGYLYTAPANTAATAFATGSAVAAAWNTPATGATGWTYSGMTEDGVTLTVNRKTDDIRVEEQSTPVVVVNDTTDITVGITFAEDTIANMVNAYAGGTVTTNAATTTVPGNTTLALSDTLLTVAVQFFGANAFGFQRQVYIPEVVGRGNIKTSYKRTKTARMYPCEFTAICPVASIIITDLTANAT